MPPTATEAVAELFIIEGSAWSADMMFAKFERVVPPAPAFICEERVRVLVPPTRMLLNPTMPEAL